MRKGTEPARPIGMPCSVYSSMSRAIAPQSPLRPVAALVAFLAYLSSLSGGASPARRGGGERGEDATLSRAFLADGDGLTALRPREAVGRERGGERAGGMTVSSKNLEWRNVRILLLKPYYIFF